MKADPLRLCQREHFTVPGRIERSRSDHNELEASDYRRLAAALVEADDEHVTVDDIYDVGERLGWSIARTELARIDAVRAGLLSR
jgi:hypothetical protein